MFNKILEKEIRIIEQTYDSKCKIIREGKKEKINGQTKFSAETICDNQDCAVMRDSDSVDSQTESVNDINYKEILFISPTLKIKQGDTVIVTFKNNDVVRYSAGTSEWFDSHQEVILLREDRA
ncbi:MAG: hypothetical protein IJX99_08570 [Clostridia bacterium]|nr:hypothetical protein [Clostridia bacterium]